VEEKTPSKRPKREIGKPVVRGRRRWGQKQKKIRGRSVRGTAGVKNKDFRGRSVRKPPSKAPEEGPKREIVERVVRRRRRWGHKQRISGADLLEKPTIQWPVRKKLTRKGPVQ
jgi:hypothetical protein